jgi:apolipoprotein N-acyltransferase
MRTIDEQMAMAPKLKVGLVEGDVGIFQSETRQQINDHLLIQQRLSAELAAQGAELIVWPESSVRTRGGSASSQRKSFYTSAIPLVERYQEDRLQKTPHKDRVTPLRGFKVPLLFGGHGIEEKYEGDSESPKSRKLHYNRAWLVGKSGEVLGYYDKVFRLVFGEYIPFGDLFPVFYQWIPSAARIEPGGGPKSLELPREGKPNVRLGVLNCYEGIIPSYNLQLLETQPDVLINLTNDDWFQSVAERYLHFVLALPRSIESRRMYLRATLTGVSAVVDANGRIVRQTGLNSKLKGGRGKGAETILYDVPLMRSWTLYSEIGDILPRLSILFLIFAELMRRGDRARERWLSEEDEAGLI